MGSGGSALSFGFAAGLAAAGGFAAGTAPALAVGGAGVLPSTGSAIFPLSDLSTYIMNRDYSCTGFLRAIFGTTSYISATPFLSRRIPVFGHICYRAAVVPGLNTLSEVQAAT
jgi:hypothetical protein